MENKASTYGSKKQTKALNEFGRLVQELCAEYHINNDILHGQYGISSDGLSRLFSGVDYTKRNFERFIEVLAYFVKEHHPKDNPSQLLANYIHALYAAEERNTLAALHLPPPAP